MASFSSKVRHFFAGLIFSRVSDVCRVVLNLSKFDLTLFFRTSLRTAGHVLGLNKLKQNVFFEHMRHDDSTQPLLNYAKTIMSASYNIPNPLKCCKCSEQSTLIDFPMDQTLRDMRNQHLCSDIKGVIGRCSACNRECSTGDIVRLHLDKISTALPSTSNLKLDDFTVATEQRLAIYAMLHVSKELRPAETKLIFDISQFISNEHSYKHRPSCFKKGHECRFNYPTGLLKILK
jgi:hypothetical protein